MGYDIEQCTSRMTFTCTDCCAGDLSKPVCVHNSPALSIAHAMLLYVQDVKKKNNVIRPLILLFHTVFCAGVLHSCRSLNMFVQHVFAFFFCCALTIGAYGMVILMFNV